MTSKLIIVSNRLPITIRKENGTLRCQESVGGGMAAALAPLLKSTEPTVWIGWDGSSSKLSEKELLSLQIPDQLIPVGFTENEYAAYYGNYANGSLWPVFHGISPRRMYKPVDWRISLEVVNQFAETILRCASPDDRIWIHDFHLVMLPKVLRDKGMKNRIGFFLHIPFPDPVKLRTIPNWREILGSLRTADLCGFQTQGDADRYLAASSNVDEPAASSMQSVGVFPVGIDYARYNDGYKNKAVQHFAKEITSRLEGKKVIMSVSRLDYTKGIIEQLNAVDEFLSIPIHRGKYIYKLVAAPSRESLVEYRELRRKVDATVARINKKLGSAAWMPIEYENRPVGTDELIAWYIQTDIMLVTPFADGMNLVAKEFIAAKRSDDGVLILSKGAGAATQLKEAVVADSEIQASLVGSLEKASVMPIVERRRRSLIMRRNVETEDATYWANQFLSGLNNQTV